MSKLLILSAMALLLPIAPALACFPDAETDEVLFAPALRGRSSTTDDEETERVGEGAYGGRSFDRDPLPMSYCELDEPGFVVVNGKCYDFDAITDFDTKEECQADPVCNAYREQQEQKQDEEDGTYHMDCSKAMRPMVGCGDDIVGTTPMPPSSEPEPVYDCSHEGLGPDVCRPIDQGDPNHGEIKGDEELTQDEEEHQEEEEQGQAQGESEETAE